MPFRRAADSHVEVTIIRGNENSDQHKPVSVRAEVMDKKRRENKLGRGRQVWWIFVFARDSPARFAAYLGGFGPEIGGWAVCNFDTTPGRIDPAEPLGSDFLEKPGEYWTKTYVVNCLRQRWRNRRVALTDRNRGLADMTQSHPSPGSLGARPLA